ncbi:MAG TPA: hypothetical protein PLM22_02410 [Candidatus Sabulitectum sp.]|nr:hypothetical protein [Candidatus Sabulitectum sp.]HPJ27757.1 hypothetical protein [Candidatus Sabulitectum sp.]HPR21699.1 hypothetical protein [Candidatus Sabulitectum sp.]HRW77902.1 hypothetical protein [Candidatus Sabulitectum sp.]
MRSLIAAAAILMTAGCGFKGNRVMVTNDTDEAISGITVSVCDSVWSIESLPPGETVVFKVVYDRDDHFRVSSPELNGDFGYVTHGITGEETEITFREDRIDFRQSGSDLY